MSTKPGKRAALRWSVVLSVALGAAPALAQPWTATITGQVIDAETSQGIPGATVTLLPGGRQLRTDKSGTYRLDAAPRTYAVRCAHPGYRPALARGIAMAAGTLTRHDCRLARHAPRRGSREVEVVKPAVAPTQQARAIEGKSLRTDGESYALGAAADRITTATLAASEAPTAPFLPPVLPPEVGPSYNREGYEAIDENPFLLARDTPLSTFSIDVDTASYSNVRRFLDHSQLPPKDAVKIEELINYFAYEYAEPSGEEPFSVHTEVGPAPWNRAHRLVQIGLQGKRVSLEQLPPSNLVFLIDVSGSMAEPAKLPLLKSAFKLLVNNLRPQDRVAIVVYAGAAGLVLESTSGQDKGRILEALDGLEAGGSTAGGAGIQLAYQVARQSFSPGGNNRVIVATDGDFNVGISSDGDLVRLIEEKRQDGIFLTVLGFGTGNYQDAKMEKLADRGNGNHAYIDSILEAQKVLVSEMGATLVTIAKDVKIQVEFNPSKVKAYRLIGYENRLLAGRDFNDDKKDAGELGAGHSVTALYELIAADSDEVVLGADPLKYQTRTPHPAAPASEIMTVKVRYKRPQESQSGLLVHAVDDQSQRSLASENFRFAAAVAEFGLLLRQSEHRGNASWDSVLAGARGALGADAHGYRSEFVRLVAKAKLLGDAK